MIKHRSSSTLAAMAQLHSMGLNRQGFPLLLSSRLFAAFIRPKLEYGLAIARLTRKDGEELNRAQDSSAFDLMAFLMTVFCLCCPVLSLRLC
ncbi:hypothetical protein G6F17_014181 [Rhizopus arrhizus]|nr:hypothetical protein G6F22_020703 [Rhizopus arrhizus]KAG0827683.1 hypothetical protein G6F17_014181 [Rhizopus arrhizus]KAG0869561.1 hypothetical protein G6F34_014176 [Rhizopus arrhizus]KAG0884607.1 hypothetical protein G6F33_014289 [Rhizopus arrhizus]